MDGAAQKDGERKLICFYFIFLHNNIIKIGLLVIGATNRPQVEFENM